MKTCRTQKNSTKQDGIDEEDVYESMSHILDQKVNYDPNHLTAKIGDTMYIRWNGKPTSNHTWKLIDHKPILSIVK